MTDDNMMLNVPDFHAHYGESHILQGMDFAVPGGEVVTLLGRNGAGKSTTLKAIMGIVTKQTGLVAFKGANLVTLPSNRIARLGVAYCPEERGIFSSLSVTENLLLPPVVKQGGLSLNKSMSCFRD